MARLSAHVRVQVGRKLAEDLHMVASPAFDPDDGSLFVTRSGSRGQQFPVTIFRIDTNGEVSDFSGDITNPTGIAFDNTGQMFVTSRMDGTVYRITPFKEAVRLRRIWAWLPASPLTARGECTSATARARSTGSTASAKSSLGATRAVRLGLSSGVRARRCSLRDGADRFQL